MHYRIKFTIDFIMQHFYFRNDFVGLFYYHWAIVKISKNVLRIPIKILLLLKILFKIFLYSKYHIVTEMLNVENLAFLNQLFLKYQIFCCCKCNLLPILFLLQIVAKVEKWRLLNEKHCKIFQMTTLFLFRAFKIKLV